MSPTIFCHITEFKVEKGFHLSKKMESLIRLIETVLLLQTIQRPVCTRKNQVITMNQRSAENSA